MINLFEIIKCISQPEPTLASPGKLQPLRVIVGQQRV